MGLWRSSLKRGSPPKLIDTYWTKGAAIMVCQDEGTWDWLASKVATQTAGEGSQLKAHHIVWGSADCNDRGVALVEFLYSSNLEILNQGNDPTFCSGLRLEVFTPSD